MKLKVVALGSLLGVTLCNQLPTLPPFYLVGWQWVGVLIPGVITLLYCQRPIWRLSLLGLFSVSLGFTWNFLAAQQRLSMRLTEQDCYHVVQLKGEIVGLVGPGSTHKRFEFLIDQLDNKVFLINKRPKVQLSWHHAPPAIQSGDRLTITTSLRLPWWLANPGSLDSETLAFKANISAFGRVKQCLAYQADTSRSLTHFRQKVLKKAYEKWGQSSFFPVVTATTIGYYGGMSSEQFEVFSQTGTLHAVAISGSHIALIAGLVTFLVSRLWRLAFVLTQFYPAQRAGQIAGLLSGLGYAAFAGFGLPTQRAVIMMLVGGIAWLRGRPLLCWEPLAIAWLLIGLWDPLAILDKGFWLSFICVAVLILEKKRFTQGWCRKWLLPQWWIFIALLPINVLFFQQLTWVSPLANTFTLPLMGLIVVPMSLIAMILHLLFPYLADCFMQLALWGLHWNWVLLKACLKLPFSVITGHVALGSTLLFGIGLYLMLFGQRIRWRRHCILGMIPLALSYYAPSKPQKGECWLHILDVGQGLAVVLQTQHHTVLFDTGPSYQPNQDAGKKIILPFLHYHHIRSLDTVIISHPDLDHSGGWQSLKHFPIQQIYSSTPSLFRDDAQSCYPARTWTVDGVVFTLFSAEGIKDHARNNQSCVLKVDNKQHAVLIMGDSEQAAERVYLSDYPQLLASDVLVVPHHGSKTSSTSAFIEAVSPTYALYAVGFHNQYGLPHPTVCHRIAKNGARNLLTYEKGAIKFSLKDKKELTPPTYWRDTHRRYWHHRASSGGNCD